MLILLVENNIDELRNLQRYVSECYTDSDIVPFSDSSDAMQFIQSDRFSVDLCFTEVVMPIVSGFELTAELRNRNRAAKIVFVSGTPDYAIDAWQYHVNDYLILQLRMKVYNIRLKAVFLTAVCKNFIDVHCKESIEISA